MRIGADLAVQLLDGVDALLTLTKLDLRLAPTQSGTVKLAVALCLGKVFKRSVNSRICIAELTWRNFSSIHA